MENASNAVKGEAIKSFQSTISKFEKALTQMNAKRFQHYSGRKAI